jgi:hypothetical protein
MTKVIDLSKEQRCFACGKLLDNDILRYELHKAFNNEFADEETYIPSKPSDLVLDYRKEGGKDDRDGRDRQMIAFCSTDC